MRLYNTDCLEQMQKMPTKSVELVLTSPPYNMNLRIRNGQYCSRQIVEEFTTKYKNFSDNLTIYEYFEWQKNVINECLRVSNLVFYNIQILTGNKPAVYRLMGHFHEHIKEMIIWDKKNAQPAMGHGVLNSQFELILVLTEDRPEARSFYESCNFDRGTLSNIWKIQRAKKQKNHGAVFPVELAEKVIKNFTKKHQTVLDPFMGTGTTGVACKNLERQFVGIELSKDYFEQAQSRIQNATKNLMLFECL